MLKKGKYRAIRNIPIGWLTHANHGRDRTELIVHWLLELSIAIALFSLIHFLLTLSLLVSLLISFFITHTIWWVVNGNFHVYLLDSFMWVRNTGIDSVLNYIKWYKKLVSSNQSVECILVYGSFCRSTFHDRSDLDLRIVRKNGSRGAGILLLLSIYARLFSLCRRIPTDLQVVDSMEFLRNQMREDERPVVVYCREGYVIAKPGKSFDEILQNPACVLREKNS